MKLILNPPEITMVDANFKPRSTNRKACFFCGAMPYHNRINCPAREAIVTSVLKRDTAREYRSLVTKAASATVFSTNIALSKAEVPGGHAATIKTLKEKYV